MLFFNDEISNEVATTPLITLNQAEYKAAIQDRSTKDERGKAGGLINRGVRGSGGGRRGGGGRGASFFWGEGGRGGAERRRIGRCGKREGE